MQHREKFGYIGKILRIDLSRADVTWEEPDQVFYRRYLGGRALGLYYLLRELEPRVDPLGKDNLLVFATSVLTGAPFPGNSRFSAISKSPLTNGFGEAEAGGYWGPELKRAGFDAIVIKGKAPTPVYIWINNGKVAIKDASHLWGKDALETQDLIRQELNNRGARVICIGKGGENLVRYAAIAAGENDFLGRMGMGAVMGSKNLKAIAVKGTRENIKIKDLDLVKEISDWFLENYKKDSIDSLLHEFGTAGAVTLYADMGALPTRNFREGIIDDAHRLSGAYMKENGIMVGRRSCYACPVACRKLAIVEEPGLFKTDGTCSGPDYESIAALGSNCGINDPKAVVKANDLCSRYGLDTISTGDCIAFALECAESGLIEGEVDGIEIKFGSSDAVIRLIEMIGNRRGVGDLLAEGVKRAAQKIGSEASKFAIHGKGQEVALQDPRGGKIGAALGYAVGPTGGDHIQMEHDFQFESEGNFLDSLRPLGIVQPIDAMELSAEKVRLFVINQKIWSFYNVLDLCIFVGLPGHTFRLKHLVALVDAVTGWESSAVELMEAGERALTMARCFNLREGFTKEDDWIHERFFQPIKGGASEGNAVPREKLEEAISTYYDLMGWDAETGIPKRSTLVRLGLSWVEKHLRKAGVEIM